MKILLGRNADAPWNARGHGSAEGVGLLSVKSNKKQKAGNKQHENTCAREAYGRAHIDGTQFGHGFTGVPGE